MDTAEGENELAPIKNLFNEWYSKDISRKRRTSNKIKGSSGIPLGPPPYGYVKATDGSKHWIIDSEAALVVQKIFSLALEGKGVEQIATVLTEQKILTPIEYAKVKVIRKASSKTNADPYFWSKSTVNKILSLQEYCGDVINFKTYSVSYKNKKRHENTPENMMVFKGIHKPIIDRNTFEKVQLMRNNTRKRRTKSGEHHIFSGLLKCADCGRTLHFHFNQGNPDIKYFNCPGYNQGKRKVCSSTHYVRADFLEQVVLKEIRRLVKFVLQYEDEFIKVVNKQNEEKLVDEEAGLRSELKRKREEEKQIDRKIEELYDFCLKGLITDDRFKRMTIDFEQKQADIVSRIKVLEKKLEKIEGETVTINDMISALKKYTRTRKLKPHMVHELIEYIEVHHAEKIDGVKTQHIVIHYNCIGAIEILEEVEIDQPEVSMQTRKGVTLNYQSAT